MRLWIAAITLALATFGMTAPVAHASTLATVKSISGSAVVMRGNKVEKLNVGDKIEPGDRIIIANGGTVKLSTGASLGAGSSTINKTKSGGLDIVSTTATTPTTYVSSPPTSNVFSDDKSKSYSSEKSSKKDDDDKGKGKGKDKDDDHDDDHDDDEDEHEHGNPHDHEAVSY